MQRRHFLGRGGAALAALSSVARASETGGPELPAKTNGFAAAAPLAPIRAQADRIIDISVCTRPFRAQGPRIEAERRFGKTLIHNYGHGSACAREYAARPRTL